MHASHTQTTQTIHQLFDVVISDVVMSDRLAAAQDMANQIKSTSLAKAFETSDLLSKLEEASENKKSPSAREGSMLIFESLAKTLGHPAEPFLIPKISIVLGAFGDKVASVKDAAEGAANAVFALPGRFAVKLLVPLLLSQLSNEKKWQTKAAALKYLGSLTETSASQVSDCLPQIIPEVSDVMWATKPEVSFLIVDSDPKGS
jgi:elongation factor 3